MTDAAETKIIPLRRQWSDATIDKLITEALAIEEESAKKAGGL